MPLRHHRSPYRRTGLRQHWHGLALVAAIGFGAAPASQAQSLQELYDAARTYDANYLSSRALLDAAQYKVEQLYALRRPEVGLVVDAGLSASRTPNASQQRSANVRDVGVAVNGRQSLFNRTNDKIIAQGEKSLEASRADFESAEQDLILRISQTYFDVLAAQDTLATARSSLTAISELVASAKRNFEVGTATITDTREAQARFDLARAVEIRAANDLLTKRVALDQAVGRMNVSPKQLAVPVVLPEVLPTDVEAWVTRAEAEHPQVRKFRVNLDIAKLETERAEAGHLPTVAATASLGRGYNKTNGDTAFNSFSSSSPGTNAGVGVQMNMPLFAGYSIQNRVKETLALETKAQSDLDATRRGILQSTRNNFYTARSFAAQVSALEAAEASSRLALEATQLGFKVGVRVNLDVLNAQAQLFDTRTQLAKARYDVVLANLRLRQASGQLNADDVASVNRLLQP